MTKLYLAPGYATYAHKCDRGAHSVTLHWRPGDPPVDENSLPPCPKCGKQYDLVPACNGSVPHRTDADGNRITGDHDCHEISGHVERADDITAGLVDFQPDPDEVELQRLRVLHAKLQAIHVRDELAKRIDSFDYKKEFGDLAELHRTSDQLAHREQIILLKQF